MKKICLMLLALLCLGALLIGCESDPNTTETPTESGVADDGLYPVADAIVIRPTKALNIILYAGQSVNSSLTSLCGKNIQLKDDFLSPSEKPDPNSYEILIGETNRDASTAAAQALAGEQFAYYIGRTGSKIVIVGTTPEMTVTGVEYFLDSCVAGKIADGKLDMKDGFSYIGKSSAVTLISAGKTDYKIVTSALVQGKEVTANINKLNGVIRNVTSKSVQIGMDTQGEDGTRYDNTKEVLMGFTHYAQTGDYIKNLDYNEYGVAVRGNKLIVFGYSDELVAKAIDLLDEIITRNLKTDKTLCLPDGMSVALRDSTLKMDIPSFVGGTPRLVTVGGGNMVYVSNTNETSFTDYKAKLAANGFTLYTENKLGSSSFATYYNKTLTVNVGFDPTDSTARIVVDVTNARPARAEDNQYTASTQTLMTQVGLNHIVQDTGMSYFLRLSDGRFIVIDGGAKDYDDHHKLYELLVSQCKSGEKPVIAAWFLTHAHADHFQVFLQMAEQYKSKLTIQSVVYNLPTSNIGGIDLSYVEYIESSINSFAGAKIIYARTGQKFHIGNAVIDVLFTPEDAYPTYITSGNNASVIYRITCEGQTIMMLGDTEQLGASILCRRYSDFLKSDIMQMAHHGYTGGSNELFALIDPETVLWPCPDHWFHETLTWECNQFIATSQNVKEIINAGHGTAVLQLPYTPQATSMPNYAVGDVIYSEDFENIKRLYEMGWFSVNSLTETMLYTDLEIKTIGGDRGILMTGKENSVLCFLRPDELQNTDVYTVEMKLTVNSLGNGFAIWYNDASPINSAGKMSYSVSKTGTFTLTLEVNRTTGTTRVLIDGEEVQTLTNTSNSKGGLIFHSKEAEVFVGKVIVSAGTLADRK